MKTYKFIIWTLGVLSIGFIMGKAHEKKENELPDNLSLYRNDLYDLKVKEFYGEKS